MQPYFFPYGGYFRLFSGADLFVVLDCVQFPRRGWVHRNRLDNANGEPQWLTLPLVKSDRDATRICDLLFAENAQQLMAQQIPRFGCLKSLETREPELATLLSDFSVSPTEYLIRGLRWTTERLGIARPIVVSSSLGIPEGLRAQDRIIEIARQLNATHYINAPGGQALYDGSAFAAAGLSLDFLVDYTGPTQSMLQRLLTEDAATVAGEVLANTALRS